MVSSKLGRNRAGKITLYRGRIVFWNHCKRSLEDVFSNVVSAGDGLQKRKGLSNGFVISLPPSPRWVPASSQSLWDSTKAPGQECCRSLFPPAKMSPCSFFSSTPSLPKRCTSLGQLDPGHTRKAGPPHNLPPPPLAGRRPTFPHPAQRIKTANSYPQLSCMVNGCPTDHFDRSQLTDLFLAPLKDPEFAFEPCRAVSLWQEIVCPPKALNEAFLLPFSSPKLLLVQSSDSLNWANSPGCCLPPLNALTPITGLLQPAIPDTRIWQRTAGPCNIQPIHLYYLGVSCWSSHSAISGFCASPAPLEEAQFTQWFHLHGRDVSNSVLLF